MLLSTILSLYEKAIYDFKQRLEYLQWLIIFSLTTKDSKIYNILKQIEGIEFFSANSGLFRELIAASYIVAMEQELFLATPKEFVIDISTYIGLAKKDALILGTNPTQFTTEILSPFFEAFLVTFQMTSELTRFIVTRIFTFQMNIRSIHFILTRIKAGEEYESLKVLTLTNYLVPTLRKIHNALQLTDMRFAATLMRVAIAGFLSQHTRILDGKKLRAITIGKDYQTIIEEYPLTEGEDIFFDISWRMVLPIIWPIIVDYLTREIIPFRESKKSKGFEGLPSLI
ncbi:MAG: hypothetical protein ACE5R6_13750 [Candidatus Heimdallarchaeota archaeon]